MENTITVKVVEEKIEISNTDPSSGEVGTVSIDFLNLGNIGTEGGIPGVGGDMDNAKFSKQSRYLNWLDSWKDLKAGGGAPVNYQQFVNGLGVWTDEDDEPVMTYNVLGATENKIIKQALDGKQLENRSWTKVKRGSEIDKKLLKDRVQHDCGLGFESFIEKIDGGKNEPLLYKTLGTFLDPAGDIKGGVNYPQQNQKIEFTQSFMNAMGFPGITSVSGTPNSTNKNDWRYEIKYGSGCSEDCEISRDVAGAQAAISGGNEHRAFNKQTTDPNRKFFGGNNEKGNVFKNGNSKSSDKIKLFVSKEMGDRMQIFCHMVMFKLNPTKGIVLITCDMVVFITCISLRLPVIYTGTNLVKHKEYREALDVDREVIQGKFYSITEYFPNADAARERLQTTYNNIRNTIINDNQKLIELVSKFAKEADGYATIGITEPGSGGVPKAKKVSPKFFYKILAVLTTIQGKLITKDVDADLSDNDSYKDAMEKLKNQDTKLGIMPTGGDNYPEYDASWSETELNEKIKNIKRDCLLLHFIHIKKGQESFSINPSIKSFTATKPAQNNKTFFGDGYTRGMTIHDIARTMIDATAGGGKHTIQTGGEGEDHELFKDYEEVIDGPDAIEHVNCEEPILKEEDDVLPITFDGKESFPDFVPEDCVKVNKSKEFVDDSSELVDKIINAIGSDLPPLTPDEKTTIVEYVQNIRRYLNCVYNIGFDDNMSLISIAKQDNWFKGELEGIISYVCMLKEDKGVDEDRLTEIFGLLQQSIETDEMSEADGAGEGAGEGSGVEMDRSSTPPPAVKSPRRVTLLARRTPPSIDPKDPHRKRARREEEGEGEGAVLKKFAVEPPSPPQDEHQIVTISGGKRRKRRTKKHAKKRTRNGKRRYTRNKKHPHNKKKRGANKKAKTHRKKPRKSKKGHKTTRKNLRRRSR